MTIEVKVPTLPESVSDATISKHHVEPGKFVEMGQPLIDLETDKVMLEVPAPESGIVTKIEKSEGSTVSTGDVLVILSPSDQPSQTEAPSQSVSQASPPQQTAQPAQPPSSSKAEQSTADPSDSFEGKFYLSPAIRRLVAEHNIDVNAIQGSGKGGRILKEDIMRLLDHEKGSASRGVDRVSEDLQGLVSEDTWEGRLEKRVSMSRLRMRVAERLLEVQSHSAILTTFNEVNMQPIMDLRAKYKDKFEKAHDVRLGFMSFFIKASVAALRRFPVVNASIDGKDIVYHGYFDVGVAIASKRGLVVPILRNTDALSMADIEQKIKDYAAKAQDGKLTLEDMKGGTFTITNGGVFGSMLSTPIINPPQSAILGMHNIVKRAVVEGDQIVVRPMMYLALSYDHRIIDGADSVRFLVAIKESLEDPARLLLDM